MRAAGRLGFAIDRSELGLRVAILLVFVGGGETVAAPAR